MKGNRESQTNYRPPDTAARDSAARGASACRPRSRKISKEQ